jgi:uncharacterized OB-fold protein
MIMRCQSCSYYLYPPSPVCPKCLSTDVAPSEVSGRGQVHSFTVSYNQWFPGVPAPYIVVTVELPEQEGLRLTARLDDCDPNDVSIGMPVRVRFEKAADVWRPIFQPAGA